MPQPVWESRTGVRPDVAQVFTAMGVKVISMFNFFSVTGPGMMTFAVSFKDIDEHIVRAINRMMRSAQCSAPTVPLHRDNFSQQFIETYIFLNARNFISYFTTEDFTSASDNFFSKSSRSQAGSWQKWDESQWRREGQRTSSGRQQSRTTGRQQSANNTDVYTILGIPPTATSKQIKSAYREKMKQYHPDICSDKDAAAKCQRINEAYSILKKAGKVTD